MGPGRNTGEEKIDDARWTGALIFSRAYTAADNEVVCRGRAIWGAKNLAAIF